MKTATRRRRRGYGRAWMRHGKIDDASKVKPVRKLSAGDWEKAIEETTKPKET